MSVRFFQKLLLYNAKTGDLICDTFKIYSETDYDYGIEIVLHGEILEIVDYYFKIPTGEHIDLPTSYRLQHYSETTGNYYFLDTEKGTIVCLKLSQ
ncbi:MAG: hypothetical protein KAH30_01300 [Caldisericia bacterium]|nr:hypothetical protein [Caldisericia bacterium]